LASSFSLIVVSSKLFSSIGDIISKAFFYPVWVIWIMHGQNLILLMSVVMCGVVWIALICVVIGCCRVCGVVGIALVSVVIHLGLCMSVS
jgi:hypothetical protein